MSPIEASQLQVTLTEGERWRRTLSVTVPAEVVEAEKGAITRQLASRLKVKGFRSGKVPAAVVAKRFGPHVEREALDQLIRNAYREAVSSHDLSPISEGEIEDVSFSPKEPLSFRVSFDVRPEIRIERVGGFKAQKPAARVPDDAIDQVLERLRDQQATWVSAEGGLPVAGDRVVVELTRLDGEGDDADPKEYEFTLGEGNAIPDVEASIQTLEPGNAGEFDIAFPDDFPDEDRRGEAQRLQIRLISRQVKELPELRDEFARA
ncbi:MAG: trigger factor, partial [Gemmatimonadota bacterium]|nr:trigger factor [Gemmatimonadota bacterium]